MQLSRIVSVNPSSGWEWWSIRSRYVLNAIAWSACVRAALCLHVSSQISYVDFALEFVLISCTAPPSPVIPHLDPSPCDQKQAPLPLPSPSDLTQPQLPARRTWIFIAADQPMASDRNAPWGAFPRTCGASGRAALQGGAQPYVDICYRHPCTPTATTNKF